MAQDVDMLGRRPGFFDFLKSELAPFPGRLNVTMRSMLTSVIVIVISMTLQVPELALSLLVVFYVTQSNIVMTRLVGLLFIVGSTLAIGTSIVLLKLTFDYPLIRILVASVLFFGSVYLMRVLKIGIVFFIVAIVVIYVQSFVDRTDQAEILIRAVLWVWVAVNYPIVLALLINTWLLPAEPARQLRAELIRQLDATDTRLADLIDPRTPTEAVTIEHALRGAVTLQKLLKFATMRGDVRPEGRARALVMIATVSRIYRAASRLPESVALASAQMAIVRYVRAECLALRHAIEQATPYRTAPVEQPSGGDSTGAHAEAHVGAHDSAQADAQSHGSANRMIEVNAATQADGQLEAVAEIARALHAVGEAPRTEAAPAPAPAPAKEPFIAPDAWQNPAYARFSLKTLLAVLICYVFYNAADWQGAHTIMLTCLIVALPSLGASTQRAMLRITGAAIGSVVGLLLVVFVIPHLDDIAGLLLAVAPVIAGAAWIAAGSERISYAGVQILFTPSLALFEHFGPSFDLTEIRDRMVAIALGVAVATFIQMSFWREGESDALRHKFASLLRALGTLIDSTATAPGTHNATAYAQQQLSLTAQLADCEALLVRIVLEPNWHEGESEQLTVRAQTLLVQCRGIALASNAAFNDLETRVRTLDADEAAARIATYAAMASAVRDYARDLEVNPPIARSPRMTDASLAPRASALTSTANLMAHVAALPDWTVDHASTEVRDEAHALD